MSWNLALLWALVPLIALSALFSGSETAITAASRSRALQRARDGGRNARRTAKLVEKRESVVGALLISNNLVNVFASSLATAALLPLAGDAGIVYASLGVTILLVAFAEILPKAWALSRADSITYALAPFLGALNFVFGPPARGLMRLSRFALRARADEPDKQSDARAAREDILGAIELHHQEGKVDKSDRDMLAAALDLSDTPVADIMLHAREVESVDVDLPWKTIVARVIASRHSRLPFWKNTPENVVGVLHARDLLRALAEGGSEEERDVAAFLDAPWFVPESTTLERQLAAFRRRRRHFALVVDEYGALVGLVTLEDILEEIVGDIADEHDEAPTSLPRRDAQGAAALEGASLIRNVNRAYDWRLPDDEAAATLGGLVFQQAQEVPSPGARFEIEGYALEVLESSRKRVLRVKVSPPPQEATA